MADADGPPSVSVDESTPEGRARLLAMLDAGDASLAAGRIVDGDALFAELREIVARRASPGCDGDSGGSTDARTRSVSEAVRASGRRPR
jgi:hypothetical protein